MSRNPRGNVRKSTKYFPNQTSIETPYRITMVLKVEECNDDDMHRVFEIFCQAFGTRHPMIEAVYPNHDTEAGRISGGNRFRDIKNNDPHTKFIKVVDTDTGAIIAKAKWNIWKGVIPPEKDLDGDFWETAEEKEWAQHLNRDFLITRRAAIKEYEGHLVSLDILAVDPAYQRRGAGRLLVKWGTAIADELGYAAIVEASVAGRPLYESEGFEYVKHCETKIPERFGDRKGEGFIWMVRPAKK
ncbi:hypothetical protein BGAL_0322g00100 [Botrytis galanthina]|uniref:N-acetyltransferase domain-containing protein n=1 Tax=Botrytis galanthina TaxID=278940 RepID=A0A4S8QZZ2_9HELO|nr:hypothetical protein BGAL_0322g00100 [Botrytis galanthina]